MYQFRMIWWMDNEKQETCGLVAGKSYQEAMNNLLEYADGEHIIECSFKELSDWDNIVTYQDNSFDISEHLTSF